VKSGTAFAKTDLLLPVSAHARCREIAGSIDTGHIGGQVFA